MFPDFDGSSVDKIKKLETPKQMSALLAEDLGFHIGDGHMKIEDYGDGKKYRFSYSGDNRYDINYFEWFLLPRKKKLFNIDINIFEIKNKHAIEAKYSSKKLVLFYKSLGIPDGKKVNVKIPKVILESDYLIKTAFLRGLADSDFGLSLKNRSSGVYPVLSFSSASKVLRDQVQEILEKRNFNLTAYTKAYYDLRIKKRVTTFALDLNGSKQLQKWMNEIGFLNKKHLDRYNKWAERESNSRPSPCKGDAITTKLPAH
jgi:intein/homing endonuclease